MEIIVKVMFNASQERFENYGNNKYLIYLPFEEDADSAAVLATILSRKIGTPTNRITFKNFNANKDWVFILS